MSPDEMNDMQQLDELGSELTEAGRLARAAVDRHAVPDPAFAVRLRAELLDQLPARPGMDFGPAPWVAPMLPTPPARPLDAPARFPERRSTMRPFAGPDRRSSADPLSADPLSAARPATRAGRRWKLPVIAAATPSVPPAPPAALSHALDAAAADDSALAGHVAVLKPSMRWRIPAASMPSRWIAIGVAASIVVASVTVGGTMLMSPRNSATTTVAVSATVVRGGVASQLAAGSELRAGDEVQVAATGEATLQLGGSFVRMAGGSDLKLGSLDPNHVQLSQVAGRVYHRVSVADGGDYQVETAGFTWRATGTAFDLNRQTTTTGEQVRGLALYDGLNVSGPGLDSSMAEGTSATILLTSDGSAAGSNAVAPIDAETLADSWLVQNAGLDARMGLPLGRLAAVLSPTPTIAPTPPPAVVTQAPTPDTTVPATAKPTAKPTPKPTPAGPPDLGTLKITRNSDSSYTFSWPQYGGSNYQYYKLVHAAWGKTPSYPASPYWACNDPGGNSWTGFIEPGNYAVRLQVVDEPSGKNIVRAQTRVVHLNVGTPSLGSLSAHDNGDGTWTFGWAAYGGGTFSYYKLVYEAWGSGRNPSYPNGSPIWDAIDTGSTSDTVSVPSGDWRVRIQAIGYPDGFGGGYAYAQTTTLRVTVP